jgi:hypothetical protein
VFELPGESAFCGVPVDDWSRGASSANKNPGKLLFLAVFISRAVNGRNMSVNASINRTVRIFIKFLGAYYNNKRVKIADYWRLICY